MSKGLAALSEREREALRLLLAGHDAKSSAVRLGLSVHTVNERLRDARRKLEVTSSREAARLLAEAEQSAPKLFGDEVLGVSGDGSMDEVGQPLRRRGAGVPVFWLSGGMLIMSLIIAAVALSLGFNGNAATKTVAPAPTASSPYLADTPESQTARDWLALLDGQRWEESWRAAAALVRTQVSAEQWESSVRPVRAPLGAVASRQFQSVAKANSLPGAPAGEYQLLQFHTDFAQKKSAIETVVLAREASGWKVAGYYIR